MNVLKKCCIRSLGENRKRTAVTIVGVILATALITGVACLAESLIDSLIRNAKQEDGDYHVVFWDVPGDKLGHFLQNVNVERADYYRQVGYAYLEGCRNPDKPYLYIQALCGDAMEPPALKLTEGRLPQRDDELVIGRHVRYNGMVDLQVGDRITLEVGERMAGEVILGQRDPFGAYEEDERILPAFEKTYTIVGIMERPPLGVESRYAPGYSAYTCLESEPAPEASYDVYVTYTKAGLKDIPRVTAGLLEVSQELYTKRYLEGAASLTAEEEEQIYAVASGIQENQDLLIWQNPKDFRYSIYSTLYGMAALALLIIMVTGVFCIRNSFLISLTEKIRLYGRLASIGATSKQRRRMVYCEALVLGAVGIPAGILCGMLATLILVKLVSGLLEEAMDVSMVFSVSVPAVILAVLLSAVTVFLSAFRSSIQAARITPINAIRSNDSVKIAKREMKCPRWIETFFGVGGRLAYRNLRRAGRKYRTTVISIAISVAVFIGLSTFVELLGQFALTYHDLGQYQLVVRLVNADGTNGEKAQMFQNMDGIRHMEVKRTCNVFAKSEEVPFTEEYAENRRKDAFMPILLVTLGDAGYENYCRRIGVDAGETWDKAIVIAEHDTGQKTELETRKIAQYRRGDVIVLHRSSDAETQTEADNPPIRLEVALQTDVPPMCLNQADQNGIVLIVSDRWVEEGTLSDAMNQYVEIYLDCEDPNGMELRIRNEMMLGHYTLTNREALYREEHSTWLLIAIFLYGFITVVALIGVTNIFNTVTTNMELRAPEFAMLRAIGMTGREFRRLVWLEGLFYGGKALSVGIVLGLAISVCFHGIMRQSFVTTYHPPLWAIAVCVAAVAALLYLIMNYSMSKINRRNIIDTIRNENL